MNVCERLIAGLSGGRGVIKSKTPPVRMHVVVAGMVQGVGFRYSATRAADRCGVTGWVRNRHDGSVEVEIEGTREAVNSMLEWLHHGPQWAKVERVDAHEIEPQGESRFRVLD